MSPRTTDSSSTDPTHPALTIGALAASAGVNVETIRYYQRKGLLAEPVKPYGGIRRYGSAALDRVRFIKTAQRLGFSLAEVDQLLRLDDGAHCREARAHAEHALAGVRARLDDLLRMERALSELVTRCHTASGDVQCPLIDALRHGRLEIDRQP